MAWAKGKASFLRMLARSMKRGPLAPRPGHRPIVLDIEGRGYQGEGGIALGL